VRVVIPRQAAGADWRVIVATRDGRTAPHEIAAIRVVGSKE